MTRLATNESRERWKAWAAAYEAGATLDEIAAEHGVVKSAVHYAFRSLGVATRKAARRPWKTYPDHLPYKPRTSPHPLQQDERNVRIRDLVAAGCPQAEVARRHGICRQRVAQICGLDAPSGTQRELWKARRSSPSESKDP